MTTISEHWLDALRADGCRLTRSRRAVVEAVAGSPCAQTPVEVFAAARARDPGLGLVSVYRTLEKLEELGLVQRVHQAKDCQAFIPQPAGHQHVLVCSRCGRAVAFGGDELEPLFQSLSARTGYRIDQHLLQAIGICKSCQ